MQDAPNFDLMPGGRRSRRQMVSDLVDSAEVLRRNGTDEDVRDLHVIRLGESSATIAEMIIITKRFLTVRRPYPATVVVCDQGGIPRGAKEVARR